MIYEVFETIFLLESSYFNDFNSFQYCFGSVSLRAESLSNSSFLYCLVFFFMSFLHSLLGVRKLFFKLRLNGCFFNKLPS